MSNLNHELDHTKSRQSDMLTKSNWHIDIKMNYKIINYI